MIYDHNRLSFKEEIDRIRKDLYDSIDIGIAQELSFQSVSNYLVKDHYNNKEAIIFVFQSQKHKFKDRKIADIDQANKNLSLYYFAINA